MEKEKQCPQQDKTPLLTLLLQQINALPATLKRKFLGFAFAGLLVGVVVIAMLLYFGDPRIFVGLLALVYLAYLALDIVWAYTEGKIRQRQLLCFNAVKHPVLNCLHVYFQEYGAEKLSEDAVFEFYIPNTKKNRQLFTKGTVIEAFFRPDTPYELMAWSVLGTIS